VLDDFPASLPVGGQSEPRCRCPFQEDTYDSFSVLCGQHEDIHRLQKCAHVIGMTKKLHVPLRSPGIELLIQDRGAACPCLALRQAETQQRGQPSARGGSYAPKHAGPHTSFGVAAFSTDHFRSSVIKSARPADPAEATTCLIRLYRDRVSELTSLAEATPSQAMPLEPAPAAAPVQKNLPTALGLEHNTLPASGKQNTLLSIAQSGHYSISVKSGQSTWCAHHPSGQKACGAGNRVAGLPLTGLCT